MANDAGWGRIIWPPQTGSASVARECILDEAKRLVYGDREKDYAHPSEDAARFSGLMNALYAHHLKTPFTPADYGIILILVKLGREVHRHKRDNLVDIAGYAEVIARAVGEDE